MKLSPCFHQAILLLLFAALTGRLAAQKARVYSTAPPTADILQNPVKGDKNATYEGRKVYAVNCTRCHGEKGRGDGPDTAGLALPPADHSSPELQKLSDGAIYWMITNGHNAMPTYQSHLSDLERWQLVNYIRTLARPARKKSLQG